MNYIHRIIIACAFIYASCSTTTFYLSNHIHAAPVYVVHLMIFAMYSGATFASTMNTIEPPVVVEELPIVTQEPVDNTSEEDVIRTTCIKYLSNAEKQQLYEMYTQTYIDAHMDIWYPTPEVLFQKYHFLLSLKNKYTTAYVLYTNKIGYSKISVICHNSTDEGKEMLINLLVKLLSKNGYIMEATGAVSWILRKRGVHMIKRKKEIEELLGISANDPYRKIQMNDRFQPNRKDTQKYTYISVSNIDDTVYEREGTLFGIVNRYNHTRKRIMHRSATGNFSSATSIFGYTKGTAGYEKKTIAKGSTNSSKGTFGFTKNIVGSDSMSWRK